MNKFNLVSAPMAACFNDELDLKAYRSVPNNVPLDKENASEMAMTPADQYWREKSLALNWHHFDAPDPYWLNRITWYSLFKGTRAYPGRPGEQPGVADDDDGDDKDGK